MHHTWRTRGTNRVGRCQGCARELAAAVTSDPGFLAVGAAVNARGAMESDRGIRPRYAMYVD